MIAVRGTHHLDSNQGPPQQVLGEAESGKVDAWESLCSLLGSLRELLAA